jgi:hypothetical protein
MMADYHDIVIAELADSEEAAIGRIVNLLVERDVYRCVALEAVARLHGQHIELTRQRTRLEALRDELRRYTAAAVLERRRAA